MDSRHRSPPAWPPSYRGAAVLVGILFIVATGFFIVGQTLHAPILQSPDYLELAHPRRARVTVGILLEVVGVLAIPHIALLLYPVLRRHDEASALGYVGLRILEAVALLVVDFNNWATVSLSRSYLEGGTGAADWAVAAGALQAVSESAFLLSVSVIFPLGALLLNAVLWRARLVPRLISGWGFAGGLLLLGGSLPVHLGLSPGVPEAVLTSPIAVQEMVLAIWLIAKGFRPLGTARSATE